MWIAHVVNTTKIKGVLKGDRVSAAAAPSEPPGEGGASAVGNLKF